MGKIRKAVLSDCSVIATIYNYYVNKGNTTMDSLKSTSDIEKWLENFNDRERLYVYEEDKTIKGWGVIKSYSERYGYRFACETSIYIHKEYLHKGIGYQIKNFIILEAEKIGYKHFTAKIFRQNKNSISFFKKFGYSIVGIQHKIGFVNNQWIDMVLMEKINI